MAEPPSDLPTGLSEDLIPPEATGVDDDVEVPPEVEQWVDETKGVERIVSVAISTSKPKTAQWIADQAVVSEQTARDHLETFADIGVIASFTSSGVTKYHADEAFIHYQEVQSCVEQYTKDELTDMLADLRSVIEDIQQSYEVDTPDDLRVKSAEDDIDVETVREYKKKASEWETVSDQIKVVEDAIRRYERFDDKARSVA